MKQFISPPYTFVPGPTGSTYVEFGNFYQFDVKKLVVIINQTQGKILYSTASEAFKFLAVDGKRIYLNVDTSGMSESDLLQVIYDAGVTEIDPNLLLKNLLQVTANPGIRDRSLNADRVSVVSGSIAISSGTISNVSTLGNYQAQMNVLNNNLSAWYATCRSRIS